MGSTAATFGTRAHWKVRRSRSSHACSCQAYGCAAEDGVAVDTDLGSHASTGRKGDWLGLEMDDTVGDNDGTIGGKKYFATHDVRASSPYMRQRLANHA